MQELTHINAIIAKIEAKLARQNTNAQQTMVELDHWRRVRADQEKKEAKK